MMALDSIRPVPCPRLRSRRRALLLGCALGTSLVVAAAPQRAGAQAFNANPATDFGSVTYFRATPNVETVQVESDTAVITWRPPPLPPGDTTFLFLPNGNTATFVNGPNNSNYVVLNRIATSLPSRFDGTVLGTIRDTSGNVAPGGTILFSSPGGIIAGATSVFDVGNLVLTTLNVVVDGAGNFLTPGGGFAFELDPVAPTPNAAVVTEGGAQILASQAGSYVAFVAPRIVHGGLVQTNGSTALIAAEEVEFTVNSGLFDIIIGTGSDNANPIIHTGSTGGPASTGGADNHVVYMVALPKNQAITALLSGQVGYEPATDVTIENGVIVLSSGYNRVNGTDVDTLSPSAPDASFLVTGGTATSDLFGYAANDMFASGSTASLTLEQDVSLFGRERARLFAANGETVAVGGDAVVSAARVTSDDPVTLDVTGGEALVSAESDGSITIAGSLRVDASAVGEAGAVLGEGTGGTAQVIADDGSVQVGDGLLVLAQGTGIGTGVPTALASDGFGGTAGVSASGQGSVTVTGDLAVRADGTGGDTRNFLDPGIGTGGNATVEAIGDADIDVSGNARVTALGTGGGQDLEVIATDPVAGGSGQGGSVVVATADTGDIAVVGTLALDATGAGTSGIVGGSAGDGLGGTATASIQGGSAAAASLQVTAAGQGGSGAVAIEDGAGNPRPGGDGGQGTGGDAVVEVGPDGVLTVDLAALDAAGRGGAGGAGSSGVDAGGQGGAGGDGTGGTARIRTTGGTFAATTSAGFDLTSAGTGGAGGDGGNATGGSGPGGDGGAGGDGSAGTAAIDVAGGSVTATFTDLASDGTGGSGGAGGSNPTAPGAGGGDGSGTGGTTRITAADGAVSGNASLGTAVLTANAVGGSGAAGAGDTAGRIIVSDLGTVAGGLAFAALDARSTGAPSAGGAAFAFSGDEGPVTVTGDVNVAVEGDASFAAAGSGGLRAGGVVTVDVGESILFDHDTPAADAPTLSGSAVTLTAGSDITGSAGSLVAATNLDASLTAPTVDVGTVTAARDVLVDAGTLSIANAVAGRDVLLEADGAMFVGNADAGEDLLATADTVDSDGLLEAGVDLEISAAGDIMLADVAAGNDILLDSLDGAVVLDSGTAGRDMTLRAVVSITADTLVAGRLMDVQTFVGNGDPSLARSITLGTATAGLVLTLGAYGPLVADELIVTGPGLLYAGSTDSTRIGSMSSGGDVQLFMSSISPSGLSTNDGRGGIEVGTIVAAGSINALNETSGIVFGSAEAGGSINILATDPDPAFAGFTSGAMTAGGSILVDVDGAADLGSLIAGEDIDVEASRIELADGAAGRDILLDSSGDILVGTASAGDDFSATAAGTFTADAVAATGAGADSEAGSGALAGSGNILVQSGGDLRLDAGNAAGSLRLASTAGNVTSDGLLEAGASVTLTAASGIDVSDIFAGGAIDLDSGGSLAAGDLDAGGGIDLAAADDLRLASAQSLASIIVSAGADADLGTLTAGGDVGVTADGIGLALATAGGSIDLQSMGDLVAGGLDGGGPVSVQAAGSVQIDNGESAAAIIVSAGAGADLGNLSAADVQVTAQGLARFDGLVDAPTIAVSSADIEIAATGALGTGQTGIVLLAPLVGGQPTTIGGPEDGPGYTLSDAEAGRVTAATLRILAPQTGADPDRDPDLFIRDLSLDGARIGLLDLRTPGIAEVAGAVLLAGVRPDGGVSLVADERIQIVTPTGSLRVREASGLPGGTMTLASRDIWSASRAILDQLRADPVFAGRNEALLVNDGPVEPRGYIEAGDVNLRAGATLLVQNSGDFATYAGITVVEDTLTITPTGPAPLDAFAFGRRINPDGSFVTNSLFFAEVAFEGRGGPIGFTDEAEFNRCIINTGICPAAIVQVGLPEGSDIIEEPLVTLTSLLSSNGGDDLVDTSFSADPLIEEPVTSGGDSILWDCDMDGDGDCDEDD